MLVWASPRAAHAALCCALCCRVERECQQVILQPGSSVASKEIRIDTRSAPGREGATPVLVTMLCGQPWPPQCQAYLGCFLCSVCCLSRLCHLCQCQQQRILDTGKNVNDSIFQLNFVIISFLPRAPESQNTFALISISCSSVWM